MDTRREPRWPRPGGGRPRIRPRLGGGGGGCAYGMEGLPEEAGRERKQIHTLPSFPRSVQGSLRSLPPAALGPTCYWTSGSPPPPRGRETHTPCAPAPLTSYISAPLHSPWPPLPHPSPPQLPATHQRQSLARPAGVLDSSLASSQQPSQSPVLLPHFEVYTDLISSGVIGIIRQILFPLLPSPLQVCSSHT